MEPVISDNLVDVTFYTQNTLEAVKTASRVFVTVHGKTYLNVYPLDKQKR